MRRILLLAAAAWLCGCSAPAERPAIVPCPSEIEMRRGECALDGMPFAVDARAGEATADAVRAFAAQIARAGGGDHAVTVCDAPLRRGFRFVADTLCPKEGYTLEIGRRGAEVRAGDFNGFFYAIQTLKQLLPAAVWGGEPAPGEAWRLPCLRIEDAPRFGYRGMMLDVARHFFTADQVKRYIDLAAMHKMNVFHWHLSDDQGWRIPVERYPLLTGRGSVRRQTVVGRSQESYDGVPYGGCYTKEEIRDVVAYAAARGVEVIPEIDLPGHMQAALAAYPELGCTGGPYEVRERWGISDEVLCAGREETFDFLEGVLEEVIGLFPSKYIHIGGDECPKRRWRECPRCQARIRELGLADGGGHTAEHRLQSYVIARIERFLNARGRSIIGWDEILEGGLAPNATVMSWHGSEGGIEAAGQGHAVVMAPNTHAYLDHLQSLDREGEPIGFGGFTPVEKCYHFDPLYGLEEGQRPLILGMQGNLWTEYVAEPAHADYMYLPRLAALAEVQWSRPERRDWERFLGEFPMFEIYDAAGYAYARHIRGLYAATRVDPERRGVLLTLATQGGAPIRYTTDGSAPDARSPLYAGPIRIGGDCTVRAAVERPGETYPELERTFRFHRATGRPVRLPSRLYPEPLAPTGAAMLVDGVRGEGCFDCGRWVGFKEQPMELTIDMQGERYERVALEVLVDFDEWCFPPERVRISASDDGELFEELFACDYDKEPESGREGPREVVCRFAACGRRYLRVEAAAVREQPAWHEGAGRHGLLVVGEVVVE